MSDILRSRAHPMNDGDRIIISGVAGKFPNSENVAEYAENLYNKVDMTDEDERRWRHTYPEIPKRSGKINGLEKFDATFFGVHYKQASTMDPQCRLLLERAYECLLDAGINPKTMRDSRTGVFMGVCFSESEKSLFYDKVSVGGFGITGCSRAMMANRISYALGLQGPSLLADTACSSSMTALDLAFSAMRNGECDAAIVGGANLVLHPFVTLQFARLGVLATNGSCRPFDKEATGYTRAEATCCIFLQKLKDCKRAYCELVYSKANCDGYKDEGITYPSATIQRKLLTEFYKDVNIPPTQVDFVEAHSTGTVAGDPQECAALDAVFCTGRSKPLLVGSVKSNIGHTEGASGCCSLIKAILAMETGWIPPNINFNAVRPGIPSLEEGRLKVVTEKTPLPGNLIGVNSFGFGGANVHCLLKSLDKKKIDNGKPQDDMSRLVTWAGRTEDGVITILDEVLKRPLDVEYIALLHSLQSETITANLFRGFGVFGMQDNQTVCHSREIQHYTGMKRPMVWVFSGMGSQWTEMGSTLIKIPAFKESIERSQAIMAPYGLDVIDILTSTTNAFDQILHSFVGIAAIQIALVDVLKMLGMEPDYVIGHSVGELGCAYADGCFTAEQMIVAAYCRGKASVETKKIFGSMAAIGMGYRKIKNMLPSSIEAACHNGPDSCTVSGPADEVAAFVADLKAKGIFAKEVPCSNIAYHSRYIADMGPKLQKMLEKVIPEPKKRSPKWLSTSVPKQRWDDPDAQFSSAKYHTHNLLNYVLFEETSALLPSNAITIEVAPHGLLQAILKKSMPNAIHVGLTQRGNKDNAQYLLASLGRLFMHGIDMPVHKLYPPVEFPVSRGTPMISPYIKWDHSEDWYVTRYDHLRTLKSGERRVKISLNTDDYEYILGHTIDGRCLFPATGYLHLVWESYGMMTGDLYVDMDVEFTDVRFLRATNINKGQEIEFVVMIQSGTGHFEITENSTAVVTGYIKKLEDNQPLTEINDLPSTKFPMLEAKDFYKELRLRGYHYNGLFRGVENARADGLCGRVKHNLNWVPFLDCLMQIHIIGYDLRSLMLPTRLQRLRIDSRHHSKMVSEENPFFEVIVSKELNTIRAGGVEIVGLHASPVARRRPPGIPILESYEFMPHLPAPKLSKLDALRIAVQLALENNWTNKVKAIEVDTIGNEPIISLIQEALADLPLITPDLMFLSPQELEINGVHVENGKLSTQSNCMIVIATHCLADADFVEKSIVSLAENGYMISREPAGTSMDAIKAPIGFQLLLVLPTDEETLVMCQRIRRKMTGSPKVIKITPSDKNYEWLEELKSALKTGSVTVLAENEPMSGIIGLVNCLRREPDGYLVNCVFVDDVKAPAFNLDDPYYKTHLKLGLAINVNRNGIWGSYRHLLLSSDTVVQPTNEHCYANALVRGDLSSIVWLNGGLSSRFFNEPGVVKVAYASLNFRDVMLASGKLAVEAIGSTRLEQECVLGFEYAGYTSTGKRVMGMVNCGCLATHVICDTELTFSVPDKWTLEQAASVPVVYLTVYIAFFLTANIQKGKKILIHAGTGGIGLAAIRTALVYGLDVYTTVSTDEKRAFLLKTFPELKEDQIGNSRDTSFERMIKVHTKGKGVDYVLNSLAEEKLHASIRSLGVGGQFLEIGKFDLSNDTRIGLGNFLKQISFHSVLADNLFRSTTKQKADLFEMVQRDLDRGIIQPLPTNVYKASEIEKAFRFLASGKHIGKVVVQMRENDTDDLTYPVPIKPRVNCDYDMSYVIPGGLGGFGLELADWLVIRGARKLVLSSSRGITKPYQAYRIRMWESYGAKVVISTADISTKEGCEKLLQQANKIGPVAGIFNLAVALRDSILENQTIEKFRECLAPKALATQHLDEVSRKLCPNLKHFVVFSSVSCGRGNAGQSNYGLANSIMERIIERRAEQGLPGKAIQWGAVGEVGLVADMIEDKLDMEIGGTLQQRISSCLQELDPLLLCPNPIVASMVVAEKRAGGDGAADILATVMNIMSIRDIKSISLEASLSELGMDSLMAVEIKQTLEREFDIVLSPQDLRSLTFQKLYDLSNTTEKETVRLKLANDNQPVGMELLLRNLGNEADSNHTILRLFSKNNTAKYSTSAIIIPGIEGVAGNAWNSVAAYVAVPTFVLQLSKTAHCESAAEIASFVVNDVQEVLKGCECFYLIGYSFGSMVALELAKILEGLGMPGKILLLDGSPSFLQKLLIHQLPPGFTDEIMQCALLDHIRSFMFPDESSEEFISRIAEVNGWESRINSLIEMSEQQNVYSKEYLRKSTMAIYQRLKVVLDSTPDITNPLKSPIALLRPSEVSVVDIVEDYGLSLYAHNAVTVRYIEGNHLTMLDNPKLPSIINELHPETDSQVVFDKFMAN